MPVPDQLARTVVTLYGDQGIAWLQSLPARIAALERRWAFQALSPFPELSAAYVAPALCADGTEAVLKLAIPNRELLAETEALRLYDGRGAARLLQADAAEGAQLIERVRPGTPLAEISDDAEATAIAAEVMQRLWRPLPPAHPFPTVAEWGDGLVRLRARFGGGTGPFPEPLVDRAERLFAELLQSAAEPVLLHGDLHHWNIVRAEREPWLAIDPKGVAGEPAYEVGALIRSRLPEPPEPPETRRLLARRIAQLAEALGFERKRLVGWALAQAVLAAWWGYEDSGQVWDLAMATAEALIALERE
jgi:streptomycin 6-kinase